MGCLLWLVQILVITATVVHADTICLVQQRRSKPAPYSSTSIIDALIGVVSTPRHGICSDFPSLPNGSKSRTIRRSNGSLILKATRHAENVTLGVECVQAFKSIIDTCIGQSIYWGGNITVKDIEYAIYNEAFPRNWIPKPSGVSSHGSLPSKANVISPEAIAKTSHKVVPSVKPKIAPYVSSRERTVGTTGAALFRTQTLSRVTGVPGSFSQTKTTDSNGLATTLPIWFGVAGAGIILTPVIAGVGGAPPPPLGLPAVDIGPDGIASANSQPQDQAPTESPPNNRHSISTTARSSPNNQHSNSRTAHSSSSVSTSSSAANSQVSSSTSSATPKASVWPYVISPKSPHDPANDALTSELKRLFPSDYLLVSNIDSGVIMWSVLMTESQANNYRSYTAVSSVDRDCPVTIEEDSAVPATSETRQLTSASEIGESEPLQKRDALVSTQRSAPWDLVLTSFPPSYKGSLNEYVYDSAGGAGSTIYVFDSGANVNNPDLRRMPKKPRWLFPPGETGVRLTPNQNTDSEPSGHGTCVLSKAAGAIYGVAKKANVVIVKIPYTHDGTKSMSNSVIINAFSMILEDIIESKQKQNILIISWNARSSCPNVRQDIKSILQAMIQRGVIIVNSAGNKAERNKNIDNFPAILGGELPMLVVGAVDERGEPYINGQGGPLMTVSAPGVEVQCAANQVRGSQTMSGTSFAAPMVGGLAAYLFSVAKYKTMLSVGGDPSKIPENMIKLVKSLAYPRGNGTNPVIFNGEEWLNNNGPPSYCSSSDTSGSDVSRNGGGSSSGYDGDSDEGDSFSSLSSISTSSSTLSRSMSSSMHSIKPWRTSAVLRKRTACPTSQAAAASFSSEVAAIVSAVSVIGKSLSPVSKPILPATSIAPPPPPPPPAPLPPPPPPPSLPPPNTNADPCVSCEAECVSFVAGCTAVCLLPGADSAQCGPCIAAASGPPTCVSCVPNCRRSKLNGGIDCTDKNLFKTCTGINNPSLGLFGAPGLCTWLPYGRNTTYGKSDCQLGQACDLAVAGTLSCLP